MRSRRANATASVSSQQATEDARRAWFAALSTVFTTYLFLVIGVQRIMRSSEWITGDWLINYSDGFIRRGLIGEVGRQLHYIAGVDPVSFVVVCKAVCYAAICVALLILAARRTTGLIEIAILLSPALLPFEINDPLGSGRKEIVLLALFAVYAVADDLFPSTANPQQQWRFWYLLLILPILTLIHEGLFFLFPFFFVYAWMRHDDVRREALIFGVPLVVSACTLTLSWIFRGNTGIAAAICSSLTAMGVDPRVCVAGAIDALERYDVHISTGDLQRYVPLAVLTFGPLFWYGMRAVNAARRRPLLTGTCLAVLSTAPLYVLSEDWGRWLHITGMLLFVTILACKNINVRMPVRRPVFAVPFFAAIVIYAYSWQLPHWIHSPLPVVRPSAERLLVLVKAHVLETSAQ